MKHPSPLIRGRLQRRYKRFLADVQLDDGETVTASCPNTGSMLGLVDAGNPVWLSTSDNAKRKYRHTWEMVEVTVGKMRARVGINTGRPNTIVAEAIAAAKIDALAGYESVRREVRYGHNSRIDLLLEGNARPRCYVEIKNVTLLRTPGLAEFPDARTERGLKHLHELARQVEAGDRAVMVYLIQRDDAERFALAEDIDGDYARAFHQALAAGVEACAFTCRLDDHEIVLDRQVEITPSRA